MHLMQESRVIETSIELRSGGKLDTVDQLASRIRGMPGSSASPVALVWPAHHDRSDAGNPTLVRGQGGLISLSDRLVTATRRCIGN